MPYYLLLDNFLPHNFWKLWVKFHSGHLSHRSSEWVENEKAEKGWWRRDTQSHQYWTEESAYSRSTRTKSQSYACLWWRDFEIYDLCWEIPFNLLNRWLSLCPACTFLPVWTHAKFLSWNLEKILAGLEYSQVGCFSSQGVNSTSWGKQY